MLSQEISKRWIDFFASRGHTVVPSASLISNEPGAMFTIAGMVPFIPYFLGRETPPFSRATSVQKCIRTLDIEEVGKTARHGTFFQMAGNFSFGDYFKEQAIPFAYELLTTPQDQGGFGLDPERLWVTIYEGDDEAFDIWHNKVGFPAERIQRMGMKENYWSTGQPGPAGPDSEIFYDRGPAYGKEGGPAADDDRYIEIWNLVFMQYNRKADGSLEPLPAKNIDTGMGFERLCMVLQGKTSNYDTDVFSGMIGKIEELSGHKYHENGKTEVAMRVIADHIRAIAFSIADGQLPSNVKAGYVIRRILRRAVRYGYTFLGFDEPFLCALIPQLVSDMGEAYPELGRQQKLIESVIREEEMSFLRTLDRGIRLMDDYVAKNASTKTIPGEDAFVLYDTYGFPIDLTELIASEKGYTVDMEGFAKELQKQKDRARNATANEFGDWVVFHEGEEEAFLGYDNLELEGVKLLKQRTVKQKNKTMFQLVFDRTPFYAEMGGQVGDTGVIVSESGEQIRILNTVKENNLTIHIAERIPADSTQTFTLKVDASRRLRITANHTATHLLDYALRETLGTHIEQKGSFVGPDYFRFDFSHFAKVTDEELRKVEHRVNELIRADYPLQEKRDATMEEANAMGAIALFGEKYGDRVRVVRFGDSVELCGGTHAASTGRIGFFKIVSESAIAAGVRRIEAVTGEAAEDILDTLSDTLKGIRTMFNNAPDVAAAVAKLINENSDAKKKIEEYAKEKAAAFAKVISENAQEINGIKVVKFSRDADPAMLREAAAILQKEVENFVFAAAFCHEGKPQLVLMYSNDLVAAGHSAANDIREAARFIQGGGGGQPILATAGGRNADGLQAALDKMVETITA